MRLGNKLFEQVSASSPDKTSNLNRKTTNYLKNLWNKNDHTVCKVLAILAKIRLQSFFNKIKLEEKVKMVAKY